MDAGIGGDITFPMFTVGPNDSPLFDGFLNFHAYSHEGRPPAFVRVPYDRQDGWQHQTRVLRGGIKDSKPLGLSFHSEDHLLEHVMKFGNRK
jgi:hypothetical protein